MNVVHISANILPTEIFYCTYIGTALDLKKMGKNIFRAHVYNVV